MLESNCNIFKQPMSLLFRFAHLISLDFFDDLFGVLNELVVADVSFNFYVSKRIEILLPCIFTFET